jgi:hypothetical protein
MPENISFNLLYKASPFKLSPWNLTWFSIAKLSFVNFHAAQMQTLFCNLESFDEALQHVLETILSPIVFYECAN